MTINETLTNVYTLYPSIRAWIVSRQLGPWSDAASAKMELRRYVGPGAEHIILEAHHIRNERDVAFVRGQDALDALSAAVDAIYARRPLANGLFPKGSSTSA